MDGSTFSTLIQENKAIVALIIIGFVLLMITLYFSRDTFATFEENMENVETEVEQEFTREIEVSPQEPATELSPLAPQITNNASEIKPEDLLPQSQESEEFNKSFPGGQGDISDKNFLIAGYNIGINTVSSSLRNANLQLRSDPYIKREDIGPWGQSTIMASDITNRKTLEIGS